MAGSLLGLLLVASDLLIDGELAALDCDEDVGVLCGGRDELGHDKLGVLACAHAQRLEALQVVLIVNLQLLEGEARVLHQVAEEGRVLHWLDHFFAFGEGLHGNA